MKYAAILNVGVVWNSCGCGMVRDVDCVMWNMLCFDMWWCEMVVPRPTAVSRHLKMYSMVVRGVLQH